MLWKGGSAERGYVYSEGPLNLKLGGLGLMGREVAALGRSWEVRVSFSLGARGDGHHNSRAS